MPAYWFKLYVEILDDSKLNTLPTDRLKWRFIQCCALAAREGKDGLLPDARQIAWSFHENVDDVALDLHQLEQAGFVEPVGTGWNVINFAKRQAPIPDSERYAEFRKRNPQYERPSGKRDANEVQTPRLENRLTDKNRIESDAESDSDAQAQTNDNDESPAFTALQTAIEQRTGILTTPLDIPVIDELVKANATPPDIDAAIAWFKGQDKVVRSMRALVGPVRYAISQRIQGAAKGAAPVRAVDKRRALAESWGAILDTSEAESD